jgi:hypothetical protein
MAIITKVCQGLQQRAKWFYLGHALESYFSGCFDALDVESSFPISKAHEVILIYITLINGMVLYPFFYFGEFLTAPGIKSLGLVTW